MDKYNFQISISPMTADDVPAVHALERVCFSMPWDIAAYYEEVRNPASVYFVARAGEEIVGFGGMWVVSGEAHVVTVASAPAHRRQGIGRLLMEVLIAEARRRDVEVITLEVRIGNTPARTLYDSLGFQTIATRRNYYPDNGEDALVMGLEL